MIERPTGVATPDGEETSGRADGRGAVQDAVLARLRRALMVGALVPGQVLSLRRLAAEFGTSPMPVRKALSDLVAANVLEALPSRSVRVPRLSPSRLKELAEVRVAIEGLATTMACERAGPAVVDELERINAALTDAIARRDIVACLTTNQEFHFTLYEAAKPEVLMPLVEALWLQCGPTLYYSLLAPDSTWDASSHVALLHALRAGDGPASRRAIEDDIRTTTESILKGPAMSRSDGPLASPLGAIVLGAPGDRRR